MTRRGAEDDVQATLHSDRGAAYVEFLIAVVPMMILFWGIMQLNGLLLADLVARHAAVHAVRAAIVCDSQVGHPQSAEELEAPGGCAYEAAKLALSAVRSFGAPDFSVRIEGASRHGNAPVTATVIATYRCQVPLASSLLCTGLISDEGGGSAARGVLKLTRKATLPNQGAGYEL
jgi:Flp pilus assembly protein TadG